MTELTRTSPEQRAELKRKARTGCQGDGSQCNEMRSLSTGVLSLLGELKAAEELNADALQLYRASLYAATIRAETAEAALKAKDAELEKVRAVALKARAFFSVDGPLAREMDAALKPSPAQPSGERTKPNTGDALEIARNIIKNGGITKDQATHALDITNANILELARAFVSRPGGENV